MHPLDEAIIGVLRDGPKTRKQMTMAGVAASPSLLGNHLASLCRYRMVYVVGYAKGLQKIYGLEPPATAPERPPHQADAVLEILRDGPMTTGQMEAVLGRGLSNHLLPRLEESGQVVRVGLDPKSHAILWRRVRWAIPGHRPGTDRTARRACTASGCARASMLPTAECSERLSWCSVHVRSNRLNRERGMIRMSDDVSVTTIDEGTIPGMIVADPEPKKGFVVTVLRSGARIVERANDPRAEARIRASSLRVDGQTLQLYEDAVLEDPEGSVIMHLTCADLTDAVMVGWTD